MFIFFLLTSTQTILIINQIKLEQLALLNYNQHSSFFLAFLLFLFLNLISFSDSYCKVKQAKDWLKKDNFCFSLTLFFSFCFYFKQDLPAIAINGLRRIKPSMGLSTHLIIRTLIHLIFIVFTILPAKAKNEFKLCSMTFLFTNQKILTKSKIKSNYAN